MQLPFVKSDNQSLELLQTKWMSILNPLLANDGPFTAGKQLFGVMLNAGSTTIPINLGRIQRGWFITDITSPASIYRDGSLPLNENKFVLVSSAATVVNLWVF